MKRLLCFLALTALPLLAADVSDAVFTASVTQLNTGESALVPARLPFPMSSEGLIAGGFMATDGLDAEMLDSNLVPVPFMPSPMNTDVEVCKVLNGGAWTTDTTDCNDAGTGDIELLPAIGANLEVNDSFYFGAHWPFRILRLAISTAGVFATDPDIVWEYCSVNSNPATTCDIWAETPNGVDGTDNFTITGVRVVSWDITDMQKSSEDSVESYWIRARVTTQVDNANYTIRPLGSVVDYDMGMWWTHTPTLAASAQASYSLYLGQSDDRDSQHYIPGADGLITGTTPSIGSGDWVFEIKGWFDPVQTGSLRQLVKRGGVEDYLSWSDSVTGTLIAAIATGSEDCNITVATGLTAISEHTITLEREGTTCRLRLDGSIIGTDVLVVGTPSFANAEWVTQGSVTAVEYIKYNVGSIDPDDSPNLHYELTDVSAFTAIAMPNQGSSGSAGNATPSFPPIPSEFTSSITSLSAAISPEVVAAEAQSQVVISEIGSQTAPFAGGAQPNSSLPFYDVFSGAASSANIPVAFFYIIIMAIGMLVGMMLGYKLTDNLIGGGAGAFTVLLAFAAPAVGVASIWAVMFLVVITIAGWLLLRKVPT